jgi:hypothetical protein
MTKRSSVRACAALLAFAFAAVPPAAPAAGQRYAAAVTPLLDGAAGKPIGSIAPGAALDVAEQSGSATHVTLHGFTGKAAAGAAQAVSVDGWVPTSALVDDLQTVWKSASALYAQKCSQCHALPPVNSYSANQWPAIMKTQADNAGLDPGQAALITTYLQVQSGH